MTAEKYIKDNTFQTEEDSWDVVEVEYVYEAIKMARKEEKDKACKAYCLASGCDDAHECHRDYCLEMEVFEKLLNK